MLEVLPPIWNASSFAPVPATSNCPPVGTSGVTGPSGNHIVLGAQLEVGDDGLTRADGELEDAR